jgi:hypothetical protein
VHREQGSVVQKRYIFSEYAQMQKASHKGANRAPSPGKRGRGAKPTSTPNLCRGKDNADPHIHSATRLPAQHSSSQAQRQLYHFAFYIRVDETLETPTELKSIYQVTDIQTDNTML